MATRKTDDTATATDAEKQTTGGTATTSTAGDTTGITFTPEGKAAAKVASADDYPDSTLVTDGEWNPETHGEPPDAKPVRNF